jgi:hypothetical protein
MIEILPTTLAHLDYLGTRLRAGELHEIACLGSTPADALRRSYAGSIYARTGIADGRIAAVWGCGGSPLGGVGEPWLLTTPEVERIPIRFVKVARQEVGQMLALFPVLSNYVSVQYRQACKLLEVIGFRLGDPVPIGSGLWHEFRMERD